MGLLALCYPKLAADDQRFIDEFRHHHDHAYRDVVRPHFTVVFQVRELAETVFSEHVAQIARASRPFSFVCRYAMVHDDDSSDDYYVFLVPDEGFSELALLHDALYTNVLTPHLRLDIPYVPHVGIATLKDPRKCKELADELNAKGLRVGGRVDKISVVEYDGKVVTDLRHFRLGNDAS